MVPAMQSTIRHRDTATSRRRDRSRHFWHRAAAALFRAAIPRRAWPMPAGATEFSARTRDGVRLAGWQVKPAGAVRGTALLLHGIVHDCSMDGLPEWGRWCAAELGWHVVAIDLRGHGRSGDGLPSLGAQEAEDARDVLDALARAGAPRPWVLIGGSLGALAAQRLAVTDARVDGCLCLAMPGSPWVGVVNGGRAVAVLAAQELAPLLPRPLVPVARLGLGFIGAFARLVGRLLVMAHGWDVLADGDARNLPLRHRPVLAHLIGDQDRFDWRATWRAWRHLRAQGVPGWFTLVRGRRHPPQEGNLLQWHEGIAAALRRMDRAVRGDRGGPRVAIVRG